MTDDSVLECGLALMTVVIRKEHVQMLIKSAQHFLVEEVEKSWLVQSYDTAVEQRMVQYWISV